MRCGVCGTVGGECGYDRGWGAWDVGMVQVRCVSGGMCVGCIGVGMCGMCASGVGSVRKC